MTISRRPLIESISTTLSPVDIFEYFRDDSFCFFLDSGMDPKKLGRFSFMGSRPFLTLSARNNRIIVKEIDTPTVLYDNPFDVLGRYLNRYRLDVTEAPVPFISGAVGYLSYDLGHHIEKLPRKAVDDISVPEMLFGFYDLILAYDHETNNAYLISSGFPKMDETKRRVRAWARMDEIKNKLEQKLTSKKSFNNLILPLKVIKS